MDILGLKPIIASDLNLALQITVLIGLAVGYMLCRNKTIKSIRKHERLMPAVVALNLVGFAVVMLPSFISAFSAVLVEFFEIHFPLTLLHAAFGTLSAGLGITLIFKKFRNVRLWMRATLIMWFITLALGFIVYFRVFEILHAQGLA